MLVIESGCGFYFFGGVVVDCWGSGLFEVRIDGVVVEG